MTNPNLFITALFLFLTSILFGQINNSEFKIDYIPGQIDVCQATSNSEITVLAKDIGLSNFEITIGLPPGVLYESGSIAITNSPAGYTATEINVSDLSNPVFSIANGATWAAGDEIVFTITRSANCAAVDHSLNSGTFKEEVLISYDDSGTPKMDADLDPSINSYQVNYGVLSILPVAPRPSTVGTTETRDVLIRQGGVGCLEQFEFFIVVGMDLDNYTIAYNNNQISPVTTVPNQTGTADTLFYTIDLSVAPFNNVGDGDSCFENGEEILLVENFHLSGCDYNSTFYNANWGCNMDVCQKAVEQEGVVNISNGIPDIKITAIENPKPELCDTITYVVQITNSGIQTTPPGGSVATDLAVIFGLRAGGLPSTPEIPSTWGSLLNNSRYWGNFKLNGYPVVDSALIYPSAPSRGPAAFIPPNFYTTDPDGPGGLKDIDNDGYFDDLQTGDTLEVCFQLWIKPRTETCGYFTKQYMGFEAHNFDVSYRNQCGDAIPADRLNLNYTNILRDYKAPSTFDGPIDINDGDVFTLEFFPRLLGYGGSPNSPLCNGEPMLSSSSSNWTVTLDLPPGFILGPNPQPNPAHAGLNPTIVQVGNQVIYTVDHFTQTTFPIQLELDCSLGSVNPAIFNITSNYECIDDNGNACWQQDIHCMSLESRTHCGVGGCVGIVTRNFDAKRTTPGWTDPTRSAPVVLNNSGDYNLDYYYPFDTMLVVSKGTVSDTALSDLFFQMNYSNTASGIDQIRLVRADIEIGDVSTGMIHTFPITNLPTPVTTGTDSFNITFDLSPYNEQVSPTYLYGGDSNTPGVYSTDSIKVYAYFEVADDFNTAVQYQMTNFSGVYYSYNTQGERVECDLYGDRAWFEKVRMNAYVAAATMQGCLESSMSFLFCHVAATGDNFNLNQINEYRPPYRIDSFVVTIPPELRFTGNISLTNNLQNLSSISSYQLTGNTLVIYPPNGWKDVDKISTYWGNFKVGLIGVCETPENTEMLMPYEWHYTEYYYHPNSMVHVPDVKTGRRIISYYPPRFSIQAQNPIVNGVQQVAFWDVDICNTVANWDVGYNWLSIEDNPNIQLVSVEDVTGGGSIALPYTVFPDGIYVEFGALNRTDCKTIRISAEYTDCAVQTIDVNHGWDCQEYPNTIAGIDSSCYQTETLSLIPQPSQVQLSILDQPNVISLCSLLTYELEINSAQLADLVNPYFNVITSNAPGVTINSVNIEYPAGSGSLEVITPSATQDTLFYNLMNHTQVATNGGLNGTFTSTIPGDRNALVTIELNTDCNFVSGSTLFFQVGGAQPCGARAIGDQAILISDNLEIPEANDLYDANVAITTNSLDSICNSSAIVDVQIFITDGITAGYDSSFITLPPGTSFDTGTFNCTPSAGVFCPTFTLTTVNGLEVLELEIPVGMTSGDLLDFSFQVTADLSIFSQGDSIQIVNTTVLNDIACGNTLCDAIKSQTGKGNETLNIDQVLGVSAINPTAVSCYEGNDGTAIATPSGGNAPFTYQWSNGAGSGIVTGLSVGTYTVTITDDKGCTTTGTTTISEPTDISFSFLPTEPSCNGSSNGVISVAPSGGTPGYSYVWNTGATTAAISGLATGSYTVSIIDANGCLKTATINLTEPEILEGDANGNNPTCFAGYNGNATAMGTGGTLPYTYLWDSGAYNQTGQTAYGLNAGTYQVTITDDRGCKTVDTTFLGHPDKINVFVDAMDASCPFLENGSISLYTSGGIPGYSYLWDAAAGNQTVPDITGLALGNYQVTVTDTVGCNEIVTIFIDTLSCDPCVEFDICAVLSNDPSHPLATEDADEDGVTNSTECSDGTDPCDPCDFIDTSITLPVTADQSACPNLCPDLTPIMTILPGNIAGFSQVEVAIEVSELNDVDTDGSVIILRMPSDPRLVFVWDIGLTMAALIPVQNPKWNYLGDNGFVHTWTYNGPGLIIPAKTKSAFGFISFYDPQSTDGQTTLTITVLPFSGGECNILNNTDSERLVYFE